MINNSISSALSFGRALTTKETEILSKKLDKAKEKAGIHYVAMNLPVAGAPAEPGKNTGIGTFSGVAKLMNKIAPLTGINAKLLLPAGIVSEGAGYSPFSSPAFGLDTKYVNIHKLTTPEYGNLLSKEKIPEFQIDNEYRTKYENAGQIEKLLNIAYEKYSKAPDGAGNLKTEFNNFKEKNKYWLDTYAEKKEPENRERYKFKQFITHKQYDEMRKNDPTKTIVDVPIGKDRELDGAVAKANNNGENPFFDNPKDSLACDNMGEIVSWGVPVLNPDRGSAIDLIKEIGKYRGKQADGIRLDAFQYNMYPPINNGEPGNLAIPDVYKQKPTALPDAFLDGLKESNSIKPELCVAEHIPGGRPEYDKNHVNNYLYEAGKDKLGAEIPRLSVYSYGCDFGEASWDSYGSGHDDPNVHNSKWNNPEAVKNTFVDMLGNRSAHKFQITFTDVFGCQDEYNRKNAVHPDNWRFRLPENWESLYNQQLQKGVGFNGPEIFGEVLSNTTRRRDDEESRKLKAVLGLFAKILKAPGPNTEKSANEKFGSDNIAPGLDRIINGPKAEDLNMIKSSKAFAIADEALQKTKPDWWPKLNPNEKAGAFFESLSGVSEHWMTGEQVTNGIDKEEDKQKYWQEYDNLQKKLGFLL